MNKKTITLQELKELSQLYLERELELRKLRVECLPKEDLSEYMNWYYDNPLHEEINKLAFQSLSRIPFQNIESEHGNNESEK